MFVGVGPVVDGEGRLASQSVAGGGVHGHLAQGGGVGSGPAQGQVVDGHPVVGGQDHDTVRGIGLEQPEGAAGDGPGIGVAGVGSQGDEGAPGGPPANIEPPCTS